MPEFALVEGGFLPWMHKFDRIFQRDHVDRLRQLISFRMARERGRLAAAGRAGDED